MTILKRRKPVVSYGTDDFAAHLAEREAALGIAQTPCVITQENHGDRVTDSEQADAGTPPPLPGSQGDADVRRDAWGNAIISGPRLDGAYVARSWRADGRAVYVCGSPARHVAAGMWRLDGRMERGQGYVCCACHVYEAGLYGIDERR